MKKYITAALLFCAALTAACSKETAGSADTGDTGALEMRVSATRAEADGEYDPLQRLAVRIYRASGELLRQYTAETLPSRLELLAGEYRVEVDAGEAVPASFTKRFYKGEKTFTVAAGSALAGRRCTAPGRALRCLCTPRCRTASGWKCPCSCARSRWKARCRRIWKRFFRENCVKK